MNMRAFLVCSTFLIVSCTPDLSESNQSSTTSSELEVMEQSKKDRQALLEAELLKASDLSKIALTDVLSSQAAIEKAQTEDSLIKQAKLRDEEEALLLIKAAQLKQNNEIF